MKSFTKSVLAVLAVLPVLAACQTLDWREGRREEAAAGPVVMMPPAPVDGGLNMALSNESVEVYTLDGPGAFASVPSVMPDPLGIPMANDPRVVVYPIDGAGGAYPGNIQSVSLSAPQGLYPMPMSGGGDTREGKLPPRVSPVVSSVYFPYGSARLDHVEREALRDVAQTAKFAPVDRVSVEGHASGAAQTSDPVRAKILNLKESMNRAAAVSEHLIQTGVPAEKIKTVGWGDTKPSGMTGAAQRRVDIITGAGQ